ncbi:hypothetical protein SAMN06265222_101310 [Neorhodopirellula lusitana]|uniref:Secreted protein n=1 Tax=Neorhodopirellula lusitana TaxID=445327 RepID=A0ABY1PRX5_9BACT|nr:hypothetical protein SAMN06265222_101310 [Neorhodopirellula lusitana]
MWGTLPLSASVWSVLMVRRVRGTTVVGWNNVLEWKKQSKRSKRNNPAKANQRNAHSDACAGIKVE